MWVTFKQVCMDYNIDEVILSKYDEPFKRSSEQPFSPRARLNVGSPVLGRRKVDQDPTVRLR